MKKRNEFYFGPLSLTCLYDNYWEWALVKEEEGKKEGRQVHTQGEYRRVYDMMVKRSKNEKKAL